VRRGLVNVQGIRLAYLDFGGPGPGMLLLHGLFGRASTWANSARWLSKHFRVVALDQRGHGWSDKPDYAYSRKDYADDAAAVIERLDLAPAVVVGHGLGALSALTLAARRPKLVRALVLIDQTPATAKKGAVEANRSWLEDWPLPFTSVGEARAYFDQVRPGLGNYLAESLTEGVDGYRPLFHMDHMVQSSADWDADSYWTEVENVKCPALVVRGEESWVPRVEAEEMARRLRRGSYVEVPGANHLVHYDHPEEWRQAVEPFLREFRTAT
jgi:pimeloyl-ACP methyl ester carboxylesterase